MPTISEQIESKKAELLAALKQLESADVSKLESERKKHEDAIAEIDSQLSEIRATLGIDEPTAPKKRGRKAGSGSTAKPQGREVTPDELKRWLKDNGSEGNSRIIAKGINKGATSKNVHATAKAFPKDFDIIQKGPQIYIKLK